MNNGEVAKVPLQAIQTKIVARGLTPEEVAAKTPQGRIGVRAIADGKEVEPKERLRPGQHKRTQDGRYEEMRNAFHRQRIQQQLNQHEHIDLDDDASFLLDDGPEMRLLDRLLSSDQQSSNGQSNGRSQPRIWRPLTLAQRVLPQRLLSPKYPITRKPTENVGPTNRKREVNQKKPIGKPSSARNYEEGFEIRSQVGHNLPLDQATEGNHPSVVGQEYDASIEGDDKSDEDDDDNPINLEEGIYAPIEDIKVGKQKKPRPVTHHVHHHYDERASKQLDEHGVLDNEDDVRDAGLLGLLGKVGPKSPPSKPKNHGHYPPPKVVRKHEDDDDYDEDDEEEYRKKHEKIEKRKKKKEKKRVKLSKLKGKRLKKPETNHEDDDYEDEGDDDYEDKGPVNTHKPKTHPHLDPDHVPFVRKQLHAQHFHDDSNKGYKADNDDGVKDGGGRHHAPIDRHNSAAPRYPPLDRDKLYADGGLIYLKDFRPEFYPI